MIGVAGTTNTDAKQGDSNFGNWVKVAAPEGNMTSWPSIGGATGYAPVGGTSLAAPVVAGIAGLLFSARPSLSGAEVEQALEASAVPVGFAVQYGRVDALAALNYLGLSDPQPASVPVNSSAPRIMLETNGDYNYVPLTDAPQAGNVLLRGQGSWSGSSPLVLASVQWQRCDVFGVSCTVVATAAKYTVQAADAGYSLRVVVTAQNGLGATTASSALSLSVGGSIVVLPPSNTAPPAISGTPQEGQALSASAGSWSGSPTAFAYQWQRCDISGAACAGLAGATSSSYVAQTGDVGSTLRVAVTASNSAGSSTATSAATAVVGAGPSPPPAPPSTQTLNLSGSLTPKSPTRSFMVTVGAGGMHAALSFSKCSSLALTVYSGSTMAASKSGPSIVVLDANLTAGSYMYEVSGGRCSFALTITSPTP